MKLNSSMNPGNNLRWMIRIHSMMTKTIVRAPTVTPYGNNLRESALDDQNVMA